jgi:putative membrane protein
MPSPRSLADRVAAHSLAWHVALVLFSTFALTVILFQPPAFLASEPAATVYRLGWKYSGPLYVVLGALAALAHAAARFGARRAGLLLLVGAVVSLGAELLGTSTGYPFGPYSYTPLLGYRVLGLVPFPIPLSWFFMLYCCLAMCGRLLPAADSARGRMTWALAAGAMLTAWDVSMDPAMSRATSHWVWQVNGPFYGMPWVNFAGWLLTGTVVARLMIAIVPPSEVAERASPSRLPLALYAVNGVMPVALCARYGLVWAAVLGAAAMALPLWLSVRRARAVSPELSLAQAARD